MSLNVLGNCLAAAVVAWWEGYKMGCVKHTLRSLLYPAIALVFAVPAAAQSTDGDWTSDLGGNPSSGSGVFRIGMISPSSCTFALDVYGGGEATLYVFNVCTGEVRTFSGPTFKASAGSGGAAPLRTAATPAVTAGVGSQGVVNAPLTGGNQMVAWVSGNRVNTGILASGSSTAQPKAQYPVGPNPKHVIAADFNGDGVADLAVGSFGNFSNNQGGNIAIFVGNGDGTFTAGPIINTVVTPVDMYAADFNGDGKMDLAVGDVTDNRIAVLLGNGNGTFQAPAFYPVAGSPQSIVAADFNGDGHLDLAVANYAGSISVLLGSANGTFQPAVRYAGGKLSATYLAWTDLNADGKLDLVVADQFGNGVAFLFGNGDGTFQAPVEYAVGAYPQFFAVLAGVNGGLPLIVTADSISGSLVYMPVLPNGVADAPPMVAFPQTPTSVAIGDLNHDGFPDMVAADGSIAVALRVPNGQFASPVSYALQSGSQAISVAGGDLNGDSKMDVVAAASSGNGGTLEVAFGNGNATLGSQSSYALGGSPGGFGASPAGLIVTDFTGDGKPDVAAGFQAASFGLAGGISVFVNSGTGTLQPAVNYPVGGLSVFCTLAGDFNGDGKLDLAACANPVNPATFTPGAVAILLGNGNGTFQTATLTPVGSPAGILIAMAAGDFNKDGKLDLVATIQDANFNFTTVVLLNNGNGTFRQLPPIGTGASGSAVALADLNGDGFLDLVVGDCCGLSESVYLLGNGDGTFQAAQYFSSGASASSFATADWNGNGVAGLAIVQQTGTVEALESTLDPKLYRSPPALSIAKSHAGNFTQGQHGAAYTITVSNAANAAPATGPVTVADALPSGLSLVSITGPVWSCSNTTATCTIDGAMPGGFGFPPITVSVNVAATAPSPQVNLASVSGGGSASANTSDSTTIGSTAAPSLSIVSSHTGSFTQGQQGATYTLNISNAAGAASTSGTVTVTETLPSGLALASMSGTGWTCAAGADTCTRGDSLAGGSSYPAIAVTVNVAANAGSPQVNSVSVAGGGSAAASATDSTAIAAIATSGLAFYPVTPCRVVDTRSSGGALAAGGSRVFTVAGVCNVPATAQAYSLNVTVVPTAGLGYLTIWPAGQMQPNVSTLNSLNGAILANAAIVPAGSNGAVSVFATDTTQVIIDINGYFAPPSSSGLAFYPVTPCRVADTRTGQPLPAGGTRNFNVTQSACNVPASAQAYSLNMTAVPPGPLTYLTAWPAGQAQPIVSTLNALQGQIAANAAIVPAGGGPSGPGAIGVYVSDASNVIVDIDGYFAAPGGAGALYFHPVTPCRVADTRNAAGQLGGPSLAAGSTRTFPILSSACGLPNTAQGYALNMTVVPPGPLFYLSTWPSGLSQPVVSTLNDLQGQIVANAAVVPAGASGGISVFVSDATNLVIDINGYFGQ